MQAAAVSVQTLRGVGFLVSELAVCSAAQRTDSTRVKAERREEKRSVAHAPVTRTATLRAAHAALAEPLRVQHSTRLSV
eukprot:2194206-Rhodomonas_salina.1